MPRPPVRPRRKAAVALTAVALAALALPLAAAPAGAAPLLAPAAAPGPSPSDSPDSGVRELTPEVADRLDSAVREVMDEARVPGVTVGIWTPDQGSYVRSFGVADRSDGRRMAPDLYTRIGSETKTFTVTALLQLVDQGKVSLDDPVSRYIGGVPDGDKISLRQLAGMRSGLYNYSDDPDFFKALTSDPQRSFTPRELLDYAFKHPVLFPPGQKFDYSNTNLILLGLVVEQRSGQPLGDYIKDHILDPAGMNRTSLPSGAEFPKPHPQGYTNQTADGKVEETAGWNPSWGWAAGAMVSTLDDLRVWAPTVATGELPDGRRMIDESTQRQRLVTPPTGVPGAGYGLGIFDVHGWIGHNGSLPGYESLTVYLPSARTTLVVLLNTDIDHDGQEPSTLLGQAITRIISPGHVFDLPAQPAAR
ncbi:serine hydrolase domain-containing protein [Streptomyces sp. LaPpAH-108]|uniref:serine hydrolase domain-containing protein n=1 Tax=Streptomyces sp. LaPpAH-108 TaxID=1155714 RepID=UPI0003675C94|nr:serine hydrolase domain-containing protein [Streptomyces sp. LaPpAH-108]